MVFGTNLATTAVLWFFRDYGNRRYNGGVHPSNSQVSDWRVCM